LRLFEYKFPWIFCFLLIAGSVAVAPFFESSIVRSLSGSFDEASKKPIQKEDLSCSCNVKNEIFDQLTYETPETCGPERLYAESQIAAFEKNDVQKKCQESVFFLQ
jgi:hypothetical protein